jgi:hypothetical protein
MLTACISASDAVIYAQTSVVVVLPFRHGRGSDARGDRFVIDRR